VFDSGWTCGSRAYGGTAHVVCRFAIDKGRGMVVYTGVGGDQDIEGPQCRAGPGDGLDRDAQRRSTVEPSGVGGGGNFLGGL